MRKIHTEKAPAAVCPHAQAPVVGGWAYASCRIAIDPAEAIRGETVSTYRRNEEEKV